MMIPTALVVATLTLLSEAAVLERRNHMPAIWKRSAQPNPVTIIPLRFGLAQRNLDNAHDELMRVSDPTSKNYGRHWKPEEVAEYFQPSVKSIDAVSAWLEDAGLDTTLLKSSVSKGWFTLDVTVQEAENLLATRYYVYKHSNGNDERLACESYSVPDHVRHHIDIITPTLHFDVPNHVSQQHAINKRNAPRSASSDYAHNVGASHKGPKLSPLGFNQAYEAVATAGKLGNCANVTTIACLSYLYNFANYTSTQTAENSYGVVEYTPNSYAPRDLDLFFQTYAPQQVGDRPVTYHIDGGVITPVPTAFQVNGESDLDLEYAMGIVYPLIPTLYQMGVEASLSNFLEAIDGSFCNGTYSTEDLAYGLITPVGCGVAPPVSVISTSYAYDEVDLSPAYETRQCLEYLKLGLMGTTFLFSSGDTGVAGSGGCIDSTGASSASGAGFSPSFPGTCPYITSVGATQLKAGALATDSDPEEACETIIYSGGGFSNVFALPGYQSKAIGSYFENHLPLYNSSQYNTSQATRGLPDLSANGANYAVAYSGQLGLVYGTSASSPVIGAIVTLINDARIAAGKSSVGFINPAIYTEAFSDAFNDITSGTNQGCGTVGFTAVQGWDPVTGLGTPNFEKLKDAFLSLP